MQISLRLRLDNARDRIVVEFEPGETVAERRPIAVEGMPEPIDLALSAEGYVLAIEIPGLGKALKAIAGEPVEKPGKPGKPAR